MGANALNRRQQAALTSAYALVQNSYKEYKDKLKELYGEEAHNAIVNSIVAEKCKEVSISSPSFISNSSLDFGEGMEPEITRTFYDSFSQRYFESTIEKVIQASTKAFGVAFTATTAVTITPIDAAQDSATGEYFLIYSPDSCSIF